jgi:hypothetical protein
MLARVMFEPMKAPTNKKVGFRPLSEFDRQPQYNKNSWRKSKS